MLPGRPLTHRMFQSMEPSQVTAQNNFDFLSNILVGNQARFTLLDECLRGLSLELSRLRYTQSAWSACNCYSQNGLSLMYFNFDDPEVLGSSVNLAVFAEPHFTYGNFNLSLRAGLGVSLLTKVYHVESNPENIFFSRTMSGILLLQLTNRVWLNEHFGIRLSGAYHHISNGGSKQPNLGMNFPTISIGAEYSIGRIRLARREKQQVSKKQYNTMPVSFSPPARFLKIMTGENRCWVSMAVSINPLPACMA